jgi:hypothetical protein
MAKGKAFPFRSLTIWHSCGHNERHALPCGLEGAARDRITASLADERCWRCVVGEAWDWLLSKPSGDL